MRQIAPSESQEQQAVIQWWAAAAHGYGLPERSLMAIPNGSFLAGDARHRAIQMRRLKLEGLRPGALDLFLAVPHKSKGGLWIEMKRKPNKPSDEQIEMIDFLECGYEVKVCYSADEAINAIKGYLP